MSRPLSRRSGRSPSSGWPPHSEQPAPRRGSSSSRPVAHTAEDAAAAIGCELRSDRQVAALRLRRLRRCSCSSRATGAPTATRSRARPVPRRRPRRERRAGRGGHRLPARRGVAVRARTCRARPDRQQPPGRRRPLGRRRVDHAHGRAPCVRARHGRPRRARGRRDRHVTFFERRRTRHAGDREDLDERRARGLGRCPGPRRHARPALRHRRLRGHPLLRHRARPRDLPPHRPSPAARELGEAPVHGAPVLGRRAASRLHRDDRGQRPRGVVPPPDRVLRLRRARRPYGRRTRSTS